MQNKSPRARRAHFRFFVMVLAGAVAAVLTGLLGAWIYAAAIGWAVAALVYNLWIWLTISPMDAEATARHAQAEDPRRATADLLILLAAVASLIAVVLVMLGAKDAHGGGKFLLALLALGTTALSWLIVHTLFTLRYAEIYYTQPVPRRHRLQPG